jgi:recombination protein RecA
LIFGYGISREGEVLDIAVEQEIIEKSGAWFAYLGEKIGQGRENAKVFLKDNPKMLAEIENKIRELI